MALLDAVAVNNHFHESFRNAPSILDRSIGAHATISDFDCFVDPSGSGDFYLELAITIMKVPEGMSVPQTVTRYFEFDSDGRLRGWLL